MSDIFGCDIGNGFCYISYLKNKSSDPVEMLPAKLSSEGMPSVAYVQNSNQIEVYNERSALDKYSARNPERLVHAIKTRLKEGSISVDGITVNTDAIYASIARDLIILGNKSRRDNGLEPIYDIVFTFPNLFVNDLSLLNRMQKSIESVVVDGHKLNVVSRIPEAAAVAIDYLYYMKNINTSDNKIQSNVYTVLVYDLGHGTFDTSVVRVEEGKTPELLIKDYAEPIGGINFDKVIENELLGQLNRKYDFVPKNANEREKIRRVAVTMKHQLTDSNECSENISLGSDYYDVTLTREKFEELSSDLLLRTISKTYEAYEEAKKRNIKIDAIVLSGGSSQMPMVKAGLHDALGDENVPVRIYRPNMAVSFGAARYAFGEKERIEEKRRKDEERRRQEAERKRLEEERKKREAEAKRLQDEEERKRKLQKLEEEKEKARIEELEREKKRVAEEYKPSTMLEQNADYSYGFMLGNQIVMVVRGDEKLPAKSSSSIRISIESGEVELRVYRSKTKGSFEFLSNIEEDGFSIQRFTFYLPQNQCTFSAGLVVKEDYNVEVICKMDDGTVFTKSTLDPLDVLYRKGEA